MDKLCNAAASYFLQDPNSFGGVLSPMRGRNQARIRMGGALLTEGEDCPTAPFLGLSNVNRKILNFRNRLLCLCWRGSCFQAQSCFT